MNVALREDEPVSMHTDISKTVKIKSTAANVRGKMTTECTWLQQAYVAASAELCMCAVTLC